MLTYARPIFNLKNKWGNPLWHVAGWFLFIAYESFAIAMATGSAGKILFYVLHYGVNILLFYFHARVLLPVANSNRKQLIWKLPILTAIELCLFLAVKFGTDHLIAYCFPGMSDSKITFDEKFIYGGIWRSVYFILLSSGYYYLIYYIQERDNRELLEKRAYGEELKAKENLIELNSARNAFLRAQINPHFLFNTLSFIYSKIHKTDPKAGKTLSLLSKIMRYALESGNGPGLVRLEEELEQAQLLLELWRIRQEEEKTEFIVKIDNDAGNVKFIPLVILTLLENMFKHGNLSMREHPGMLKIDLTEGYIEVKTSNLINTGLNDSGHHTGLKNIRQRLFLTYEKDASMECQREGEYFNVTIKAPAE
ncbi:sensor histidine kinase [Pedobacter sp. 22163]|uniref:sensor histidine kinase n=1 Tax=Pedobacter sp. 22163 TaxID=3453883 RepID=UPI003F838EE4